MEQVHEKITKLTSTPNRSTHQLQQIKRADMVIQSQTTGLASATTATEKLSRDYEKLIKTTKESKGKVSRSTSDNTDYVLQHTAELVDQQLRVLEKAVEILEDNKKL